MATISHAPRTLQYLIQDLQKGQRSLAEQLQALLVLQKEVSRLKTSALQGDAHAHQQLARARETVHAAHAQLVRARHEHEGLLRHILREQRNCLLLGAEIGHPH